MVEKKELLEFLKQNKSLLTSQYHLSKIGIFGSFARGEQQAESDIDLIVEFKDGTQDLAHLKSSLKKLLKDEFQKEVDICREKYIKPYYKKRILRDAIFI
jgi:predicted nucleotidyltransferase